MPRRRAASISITLSPTQVDASCAPLHGSRAERLDADRASSLAPASAGSGWRGAAPAASADLGVNGSLAATYRVDTDDRRLSRSLLRGLSLLTASVPTAASAGSSSWPTIST